MMPRGGMRIGAGRPGRDVKVEDCRRLDVRRLQKDGLLAKAWSGEWRWRDALTDDINSSMHIHTCSTHARLAYACNGVTIHESIRLHWVHGAFGGGRAYFRCPGCSRCAAILLLRHSRFRCRRCHDLRYQSQSEDGFGRSWLAQHKLERKLDANWRRPKGMHATTWDRLFARIVELEMERDDMLCTALKRHGW